MWRVGHNSRPSPRSVVRITYAMYAQGKRGAARALLSDSPLADRRAYAFISPLLPFPSRTYFDFCKIRDRTHPCLLWLRWLLSVIDIYIRNLGHGFDNWKRDECNGDGERSSTLTDRYLYLPRSAPELARCIRCIRATASACALSMTSVPQPTVSFLIQLF